jgi:hypothetical protein
MITITHTHADGTMLEGSAKGDGVYEILKGLHGNWRYFPSLRQIGIGQSRDKAAKTWVIESAAKALRAAGHEVTVEVDEGESRSFAEQEAERNGRADERAERFTEYAGNAAARSDAAWRGEHAILDGIPAGQPILVGHHSERRHRRDLERAENLRRKGSAEADKAEYLEQRADAAAHYQQHRENVPTTLRRIEKLEAEERGWLRTLDGRPDYYTGEDGKLHARLIKPGPARTERINANLTDVREQLTYWREHVAKRQAEGVKVWSRADFTKGDYVRFMGTWFAVLRVSGKSVTIPAMINDGAVVHKDGNRCTWTDTIPYHKVTGRKSGDEIAALMAEVDRRLAEKAAS